MLWGPLYVDEAEFAELERCLQNPQEPTESIYRGVEMIRLLYPHQIVVRTALTCDTVNPWADDAL